MPSITALQETARAESGAVFLYLITIDHANLDDPIRVVFDEDGELPLHDPDDPRPAVISQDRGFYTFPVGVQLPSEEEDDDRHQARLIIGNVDRRIADTLRALPDAATVTIETVLRASPDFIEESWPGWRLSMAQIDTLTISAELTVPDLSQESYPHQRFTPAIFSGLL